MDSVEMKRVRSLAEIAHEIRVDWGSKIYVGAVPYLRAMLAMEAIKDMYGVDNGKSIVSYFLSNAGGWRGGVARRVKAELRKLLAAS